MATQFWPVEYASDALSILLEKENNTSDYLYQSPQLSSRPALVKWIFELGEQFKLGNCTVHLAVYILDKFMDGHSILVERLNLTALTCFQLAAKFEEQDFLVPKLSELNSLVNNQYQRSDFLQFESFVLKYLDWNLFLPTAAKFAEYYSLLAVLKSECDFQKYSSYEDFWCEVQQAIKDYLNSAIKDGKMLRFKPSEVACSCIILARQKVGVRPLWTSRLAQVTRYKSSDLKPCAHTLLRININNAMSHKRKLTESPDQGYVTEDSLGVTSPTPKKVKCGNNNAIVE